MSGRFTELFGNADITPSKSVPPFKTLPRVMNDTEIKQELDVSECTLEDVAAFLENPPKGTDDRNCNLFYLPDCVVHVSWDSDYREWLVVAWELDDDVWLAGLRVFSASKTSDTSSCGHTCITCQIKKDLTI